MSQQGSGPVMRLKFGKVTLSVFQNQKDGQEWHSFNISKSYKGTDGSYRDTSQFNADDLANLKRAAEAAMSLDTQNQVREFNANRNKA